MSLVRHYIPCPDEKIEDSENNTTSEEHKACPHCKHMYMKISKGWFIPPEYAQSLKKEQLPLQTGRLIKILQLLLMQLLGVLVTVHTCMYIHTCTYLTMKCSLRTIGAENNRGC